MSMASGKWKGTNDRVGALDLFRSPQGTLAATPGVSAANNTGNEAEGKCRITIAQPMSEVDARHCPAHVLIGNHWKL